MIVTAMLDPVDTKRSREVALCERLADHLRAESGADYRVERMPDDNIADVVLKSASAPDRYLQVVTVPTDAELREDTDRGRRLEQDLIRCLKDHRVTPCGLTVHLGRDGRRHNIPRSVVNRLAELVAREFSAGAAPMTWNEDMLFACAPELCDYVAAMTAWRLPESRDFSVSIPLSAHLPEGGEWIVAAITQKLDRYGGTAAVERLGLVIGALGLITGSQIEAFRQAHPPESLPFAEIWLVSAFEGVVPLKPLTV